MINSKQFVSNTIWKVAETVMIKGIGLVVSTFLARMIAPEIFGLLSLVLAFLASFEFLANSINNGLIVKNKVDITDYSTTMITNLVIAVIVYLIVFFAAPVFAKIYNSEQFTVLVRIYGLIIFPEAFSNIVKAKAIIELKTKLTAMSATISTMAASAVGLIMAIKGCGIWALVAQRLVAPVMDAILVTIFIKWDFSIDFSLKEMKYYLKFGAHIAASNVVNSINNNICSLIGGSVYTKTDLGYSSKGNSYAEIVGLYAFGTINSFSLMAISSRQGSKEDIKNAARKIISMSMYVVMPIMIGLLAVADTLIPLWLTEVWVSCIPFFKIACIRYCITPVSSLCGTVLRGMGKNNTCTILSVISACISIVCAVVITLILRLPILFASAFGLLTATLFDIIIFSVTKKHIDYRFSELIKDIFAPVLMSAIMLLICKAAALISIKPLYSLGLQIITGMLSYLIMSVITKNTNFIFLLNYLKKKGSNE